MREPLVARLFGLQVAAEDRRQREVVAEVEVGEGGDRDVQLHRVDAVQLYISIAALAYFYLGNNYTLSAIFGRDLKARKARDERLAHMTALVLGYLRKG